MEKRRCPECGYLTAESKCPLCMVRIPGNTGKKTGDTHRQARTYTAPGQTYTAPRQTYTPPKQTYTPPQRTAAPARRKNKSKVPVIIFLVVFLLTFLLTMFARVSMLDRLDDAEDLFDEIYYEIIDDPEEWPVSMETEPEEWGWTGSVPHIKETVVWDQDGITVTAAGMELAWGDPTVYLTIENNAGQDISVSADAVSVNSFVLDLTGFYCEVGDGETVTDELCLYSSDLTDAGIDTIAEVGFSLYCWGSEDYETVSQTDWIVLETSDAGKADIPERNGTPILDEGGLRVEYLQATVEDEDAEILLYLENGSDFPMAIWGEEMTVNGDSVDDGLLFTILQPGYRTVCSVDLYEISDLDVYTADDLKEMSITFQVVDTESWDTVLDGTEVTFELG